jgi:hypothetical protein
MGDGDMITLDELLPEDFKKIMSEFVPHLKYTEIKEYKTICGVDKTSIVLEPAEFEAMKNCFNCKNCLGARNPYCDRYTSWPLKNVKKRTMLCDGKLWEMKK